MQSLFWVSNVSVPDTVVNGATAHSEITVRGRETVPFSPTYDPASCRSELKTRHADVVSNWWNWLHVFFHSDAKMSDPTCSNPKVGIFTDTRHLPHSLWTLIVLAYGQLKLGQILFFFTGLQDVDSRGLLSSKGLQPGYKNSQLLQCPHRKSGFGHPSPWKSMFQSTSYLLNFSARFSTK